MLNLLRIDGSARGGVRGEVPHGSHTRALTQRFVQRWQQRRPADRVVPRDVGLTPPQPLTEAWIAASFTPAPTRTPAQHAVLTESDALAHELLAADLLVLGLPMYNYGPPAGFKAWLDNVVRVGLTFDFDAARPNTYEGYLADRRRPVVLLTARGQLEMGTGQALAHLNQLEPQVIHGLGLLGLSEVHTIAIEGDELGGEVLAQSVQAAMAAVDALADQLVADWAAPVPTTAPTAVTSLSSRLPTLPFSALPG